MIDALDAFRPYLPLNALKSVATDLWTVDGPEIRMRLMGGQIPFPTRMTVARLPSGELWIHSPIAWSNDLARALAELGSIAFLIAPNTLHYWYLPEWQANFPRARSYGPPGLSEVARREVRIDEPLRAVSPAAWGDAFEQCTVSSGALTEVAFFHRPSRTLILTDLIENFELDRINRWWLRWLVWWAGAADPDGKAPLDMRLSFIGRHPQVRGAVARMIAWRPERIILAHGRIYEDSAINELRRAFRWAF